MTPGTKFSSRDEESIRNRNQEFVTAWNQHDARAMSMVFAEDGDLINPFGQVAKSRSEVEELVGGEHAAALKSSQISMQPERIRLLTPEVAVADYAYEIKGARIPSGEETSMRGHLTQVWRKQRETWSLVAARPVVPIPRPA